MVDGRTELRNALTMWFFPTVTSLTRNPNRSTTAAGGNHDPTDGLCGTKQWPSNAKPCGNKYVHPNAQSKNRMCAAWA